MSISVKIPFEDPSQHIFDSSKVAIKNGAIELENINSSREFFYFNFDKDGSLDSKRGLSNLSLPDYNGANPNTGTIENGMLKLSNNDYSYAELGETSGVLNEINMRMRLVIPQAFSSTFTAAQILGTNDLTRISIIVVWVGSGNFRIESRLYSSVGALAESRTFGTFAVASLDNIDISFSYNGTFFSQYINGNLVYARDVSSHNFDFTECKTTLGGAYSQRTNINYLDVQLIGEAVDVGPTALVGERFTYSKNYQQLITVAPMLMDKFNSFNFIINVYDDSEVGLQLMLNSQYWWYNTTSLKWEEVQDVSNINTMQEVEDNVSKLELDGGIGKYIQIVSFIKSLDGYNTPQILNYDINYSFYFGLGAGLPRCILYGSIVNSSGKSIKDAKITLWGKDFHHGETYVAQNAEYVTSENGKWDIQAVETATVSKTANITIEYTDLDGSIVKKDFKNLIIPNESSKSFYQLLIDNGRLP